MPNWCVQRIEIEVDDHFEKHGVYPPNWIKNAPWLKDFTDYGG